MDVITENMDKIDAALSSHELDTNNPHEVTKTQIGLDNVANIDTTTTSNITDSVDKRFITDAQKTVLENTSGTNTGDETNTTIINKIGYTPENTLNKGVNNGYCGLDSGGKVPLQNLPSTLMHYEGTWNASTNTPALTSPDLTKTSWVYEVTTAGTIFGEDWEPGDWLIYNASGIPEKSDNSDDVVSVNGKTGIVVVNKADVGLGNVANIDTSTTTNITDTSSKRFVSDTEKTMWGIQKSERSGITWTSVSVADNEWRGCAYGNGLFVAVARTGTHRVLYSKDAITWTPVEAIITRWTSITFGNGRFVAVADIGPYRVMHSIDGINWTPVVVDLSSWWSVTYANSLFVAVAMDGINRVMYSTDGISWISVAAPSEIGELRDITYGNGLFVAVGRAGTHRAMYSTDAITWTPVEVTLNSWASITFGNGRFVAVAMYGDVNRVMHSIDGINWTPVVVNSTVWSSVAYGNGLFVAVGEDTAYRSMYSLDASNWYYNTVPASNWRNIKYVNDVFIAFADIGDVRLITSGRYLYSDKVRAVKKSVIGEMPVTIAPADWTGTAPFEKTISVVIAGEQITNTTHDIKIIPVWSGTITQKKAAMEAYSYISEGVITSNNTFTLTCYDYKPATELTLNLEVWRKWQ